MKNIRVSKECIYTKSKTIRYLGESGLSMDAYFPLQKRDKASCVVLLHGGGWTIGDKADRREQEIAAFLCEMGIVVFSVNYHLAKYEVAPYTGARIICAWPQCLLDVMDAVSFVRANARQLNINENKIGIWGNSAGGHLALLVALASDKHPLAYKRRYQSIPCEVACAVSFYGITDLPAWEKGDLLMPKSLEYSYLEWKQASPVSYVSQAAPPIFLAHGTADEIVPWQQSKKMYHILRQNGTNAKLCLLNKAPHTFGIWEMPYIKRMELKHFLRKTLFK